MLINVMFINKKRQSKEANTYLGPSETTTIEFFVKLVNNFCFLTIFHKTLYHRCLTWF